MDDIRRSVCATLSSCADNVISSVKISFGEGTGRDQAEFLNALMSSLVLSCEGSDWRLQADDIASHLSDDAKHVLLAIVSAKS